MKNKFYALDLEVCWLGFLVFWLSIALCFKTTIFRRVYLFLSLREGSWEPKYLLVHQQAELFPLIRPASWNSCSK